jgi:hypothetical protein
VADRKREGVGRMMKEAGSQMVQVEAFVTGWAFLL